MTYERLVEMLGISAAPQRRDPGPELPDDTGTCDSEITTCPDDGESGPIQAAAASTRTDKSRAFLRRPILARAPPIASATRPCQNSVRDSCTQRNR
jgi:hypothetical protein